MSYQQTIEYLFGLQKHGVKLGLSNSALLMGLMGDPHLRFRSVHIAGTNGKGSTSAYLARMLQNAGYRTGLYTSPHLVSFTERIRVNGTPISEAKVVELAARVRERVAGVVAAPGRGPVSPTFFEVTTAVAFEFFAGEHVDIAVVEVGMGGRLDSTNVITPLVSVITNIDLEHTEFLGTTIPQIAGEKAGIIKSRVPVVTGAVQRDALDVIEAEARRLGAPVYCMPADFQAKNTLSGKAQTFDYRGIGRSLQGLRISMLGRHQVGNACLALAAAECLQSAELSLPESAMRSGLEQAAWEGRLELISPEPDIYLDGAHNPASARVLADALGDLRPSYGKLVLVLGILSDKDHRGIIGPLAGFADHVIVTRPEYARAMNVQELAREVRSIHGSVEAVDTVSAAIAAARSRAGVGDCIVITGSLYTVGEARALLASCPGAGSSLAGLKG